MDRAWRSTSLFIVAALFLAACSSGGGGGSGGATPAPTPSPTGIGPAGGTVTGPNGSSVVIPAGALSQFVDIAIAQSAAGAPPLPEGVTPVGDVYAFTPHGTAFAQPATLNVPFTPASVPVGATTVLYKTNSQQNGWEVVAGASVNGGLMSGNVSSFSWAFVGAVVATPPTIVQPPVGASTVEGGSALFFAVADGAPLSYQWRRVGGNIITEATGPVLLLRDRSPVYHDGACYVVDVSDGSTTVTSPPACLSVATSTTSLDTDEIDPSVAAQAIEAIRSMTPWDWVQTALGPSSSPMPLMAASGCTYSGSVVGSTLDATVVTNSGAAPLGTHQTSIVYDDCRASSDELPLHGAQRVDYALTPTYAEGSATIHRGDFLTNSLAQIDGTLGQLRVHGSVQMTSTRTFVNGDTVHEQEYTITPGTSVSSTGNNPVFIVPGFTGPESVIYTATNFADGAFEVRADFNRVSVVVTGQSGSPVARLFAQGTVRWRVTANANEDNAGSVQVYKTISDIFNSTVVFVARFRPTGFGGLELDPDQDCADACTVAPPF